MSACQKLVVFTLVSVALSASRVSAASGDPPTTPNSQTLEFFEKDVRPLLTNRCHNCHGPEKQKGDLRLDSRDAILKGGGNGPAVVPGKPDESLLIDAVNYGDIVQMPPKKKLSTSEIEVLKRWVADGAVWPSEPHGSPNATGPGKIKPFNLKERSGHWCWQPPMRSNPPEVQHKSWAKNWLDAYLLAQLEKNGIEPAPDADRATLLRRVSFDLIGLPPTVEEVEAFVNDPDPGSYERVVDRLLASERYGERWGRHWLDLVRFAETYGHEFDYDIPNAYRYRDYVIESFNNDLPYNQFAVEHIAGDLLTNPRRDPATGLNESIVATGFYFLGEGTHSPVDVREDASARMDNQIDVLAKTFQGLTVSCARCHDHKFDAITTRDYYALKGFLQSSRHQQAFLDAPERISAKAAKLDDLRNRLACEARKQHAAASIESLPEYLFAAWRVVWDPNSIEVKGFENLDPQARLVAAVCGSKLKPDLLALWVKAFQDPAARRPEHPLYAWIALAENNPKGVFEPGRAASIAAASGSAKSDSSLFEDFNKDSFDGWYVTGQAFGTGPTGPAQALVSGEVVRPLARGIAHSGRASKRLQGVLRSKTFRIEKKYILYRVQGQSGRIHVVVDGFEKIRDPIYGVLSMDVGNADQFAWRVQDVSMWIGHKAYIELGDGGLSDFSQGQTLLTSGSGFLAIDEIRFSDRPEAPPAANAVAEVCELTPAASGLESLAKGYAGLVEKGYQAWLEGHSESGPALLFLGLADLRLLDFGTISREDRKAYDELETSIPDPTFALAIVDGDGEDERVHIRGNSKTLGESVPRRYLQVLDGAEESLADRGSGRLALAGKIASADNPLFARVMVNRIWKHHFGEGLVKSTDDFGVMGQPPSTPVLLDALALAFVDGGWSIKKMHKFMVMSHAYQMSSSLDPAFETKDPENRLLHRMNVKRLEAEVVRDAILAVSGRLENKLGGPSVQIYLSPYMTGRGRPGSSGPLDGGGRRSVYLNVRRNFLSPMLLAFDYPIPTTTIGRRNVSNVPAQALTLLNDPFIVDQSAHWAKRLSELEAKDDAKRIDHAYRSAFGRSPSVDERGAALEFLAERGREADALQAWTELCHVLINVKEFVYVP